MQITRRLLLGAALLPGGRTRAQHAAGAHDKTAPVVSVSFDPCGRLWRAEARDGVLRVSSSLDRGATFGPAAAVLHEPLRLWNDGENRPKILADGRGTVHVSFTEMLPERMAGHVRYARSTDFGRSFGGSVIVNDDTAPVSHRFDAMAADARGRVWIAWLDKRDQAAAQAAGRPYTGAALYYASGVDGRFGANVKVADHTCECCRVALAFDPDGVPFAFWRHVFRPNERDHAAARLQPGAAVQRVSHDRWRLDGCPHHGGAAAAGAGGVRHYAWFSALGDGAAIGYARGEGARQLVHHFGDRAASPGRPAVLALGPAVLLAWKELRDGARSVVMLARSTDGGRRWGRARVAAQAEGPSDRPFLLAHRGVPFLAWSVAERPFALQPLGQEGA